MRADFSHFSVPTVRERFPQIWESTLGHLCNNIRTLRQTWFST